MPFLVFTCLSTLFTLGMGVGYGSARANQSYTNLNCQRLLDMPNPITLITDGNGVVIGATFNL